MSHDHFEIESLRLHDNKDHRSEEIKRRADHFRELGFSEEAIQRIKERVPTLSSASEVDGLLEFLKERGFADPIKTITSLPAMLGYSIENINKKITFVNRIGKIVGVENAGVHLAEKTPSFLGYKFDKIVITLRVLAEYEGEEDFDYRAIKSVLTANVEDVLVALAERREGELFEDFVHRIKEVKERKIPKEEKQRIIATELTELNKIRDRYMQAYMKDKKEEV